MAVLLRVGEEQPRPVRSVNPDVPDWLAAIIERLHAKVPEQRFQSAAEVADLLGRCLAHLQEPNTNPLPSLPGGWVPWPHGTPGGHTARRRRWKIGVAVTLLLAASGAAAVTWNSMGGSFGRDQTVGKENDSGKNQEKPTAARLKQEDSFQMNVEDIHRHAGRLEAELRQASEGNDAVGPLLNDTRQRLDVFERELNGLFHKQGAKK